MSVPQPHAVEARQLAALVTLLMVLMLAKPVWAQRVRTDYDKTVEFSRFETYIWGRNFLITRQTPEDQARIDSAIVAAIDRHLQAKGLKRHAEKADLIVIYKGGFWVDTVGRLQIVVSDGGSNVPIWVVTAVKEVANPKKLMKVLEKEMDQWTERALKDFPPRPKNPTTRPTIHLNENPGSQTRAYSYRE